METRKRNMISFESFEAHCANLHSRGQQEIVFEACGLGIGGIVKINDFQVNGLVNARIARGQKCKVAVRKIIPESMSILLDVIN
jgi:hypothetical protein